MTGKPPHRRRITATHFYNLAQCPMRVYQDLFGDRARKLPFSEFMQEKVDEGLKHEERVIALIKDAVRIDYTNDEEGYAKTIHSMREGASAIFQGVLIYDNKIGRPDLLMKIPGNSIFGEYEYYAVDIKSGKSLKHEYQLQVAFYSYLLGITQQKEPTQAGIILWDGKERQVLLMPLKDDFCKSMGKIESMIGGQEERPHLSSHCKECGWKDACKEQMITEDDISLICGLTREHKSKLNAAGIITIKELSMAQANPTDIKNGLFEAFRTQAQSLSKGVPIKIKAPNIQTKGTEIYFDIEGETNLGVEYLLGAYVIDKDGSRYKAFFCDHPDDEEKIWKGFCDWISQIPDFTIIHFHHYEKSALKKLRRRYGCPDELHEKIHSNMLDIFSAVRRSYVFPTYSYSIKDLAKSIGFTWRSKKAGGAQSIFWYDEWLRSKDQSIKQEIMDYNEDDCKAMAHLMAWMRSQE